MAYGCRPVLPVGRSRGSRREVGPDMPAKASATQPHFLWKSQKRLNNIFQPIPCKEGETIVSLSQEPTNLDNGINALSTVANLRNVMTKNSCTAMFLFSNHENPQIRREVAELLLRSVGKRCEAT